MSAISATLSARLAKLLPRLASDHQGEVAATAAALTRTLKAEGRDWHDLAAHVAEGPREVVVYRERPAEPRHPASWGSYYRAANSWTRDRDWVARCQEAGHLSAWERAFLASVAQQLRSGRILTPRQRSTLETIGVKTGVGS